jgi:hypothetical protein
MATRLTDEERIVEFFTNATPEQAETLLNVIKGIVRTKRPATKRNHKKTVPEPITKAV